MSKGFFNIKKCNHCQHKGTFFPSIPTNKLKKPKRASKVKNKQIIDTTFAKGIFGTFSILMGTLAIIMGLILTIYKIPFGSIEIIIGIAILLFYLHRKKIKK